jgi:hypothetical protein
MRSKASWSLGNFFGILLFCLGCIPHAPKNVGADLALYRQLPARQPAEVAARASSTISSSVQARANFSPREKEFTCRANHDCGQHAESTAGRALPGTEQ